MEVAIKLAQKLDKQPIYYFFTVSDSGLHFSDSRRLVLALQDCNEVVSSCHLEIQRDQP